MKGNDGLDELCSWMEITSALVIESMVRFQLGLVYHGWELGGFITIRIRYWIVMVRLSEGREARS